MNTLYKRFPNLNSKKWSRDANSDDGPGQGYLWSTFDFKEAVTLILSVNSRLLQITTSIRSYVHSVSKLAERPIALRRAYFNAFCPKFQFIFSFYFICLFHFQFFFIIVYVFTFVFESERGSILTKCDKLLCCPFEKFRRDKIER